MINDIGKRSFLAVLTFIAFIVPLMLADEVNLLTNWLYIFISWLIIILLCAVNPTKNELSDTSDTDVTVKE